MPVHWRPVGPLPAATYWRRRALVAAVVLVGVVGLALLARALLAEGEEPGAPQAQRTAERAEESGADEPGVEATDPPAEPPPLCGDDVLEVRATPDAQTYPRGARATLVLSVRNTGPAACRRAVGQGAVELVVTSGDDRIWSSDDCAPGGDEGIAVLAPGASQSARASWPGTRSAPGCPPDQPVAQPGTYRLAARVGELRVPGAVFRVVEG